MDGDAFGFAVFKHLTGDALVKGPTVAFRQNVRIGVALAAFLGPHAIGKTGPPPPLEGDLPERFLLFKRIQPIKPLAVALFTWQHVLSHSITFRKRQFSGDVVP